jgi:hypothetical protein
MTDDLLTIPVAVRYLALGEAGRRSRIRSRSLAHERIGPVQTILVSRQALDAVLLTGTSR